MTNLFLVNMISKSANLTIFDIWFRASEESCFLVFSSPDVSVVILSSLLLFSVPMKHGLAMSYFKLHIY